MIHHANILPVVYLMHNRATGLYKIGYTTRRVSERRAAIAAEYGNPFGTRIKVSIQHTIQCESADIARSLESSMHQICAPWQFERSEWFSYIRTLVRESFEDESRRAPWSDADTVTLLRNALAEVSEDNDLAVEAGRRAMALIWFYRGRDSA